MKDISAIIPSHMAKRTALNYGDSDAASLMEMLFNIYTQFNCFDNDAVRKDFENLYEAMNSYSLQEIGRMIYPVCTHRRDHE